MAPDARAITIHEAIHPDWESVKEWTKARIHETALCAVTVTLAGGLVFSLHRAVALAAGLVFSLNRAMEHYVIMGF